MIGLLAGLIAPAIGQRFARAGAWALVALGAALLISAAWLWLDARERADDRANQEIGRTQQREADLTATLSTVEKANEAAETVRRSPDAARDECLRNARNPADC